MLAVELVKGYGRKAMSPRCMAKIDVQNAYDSLEWHLLEEMLLGLGFPSKFNEWVMDYVRLVSYSILLNRCPLAPFKTKKGLIR